MGFLSSPAQAADFSYNNTTTGTIPDGQGACASQLIRTINVTDSFTIGDVNLGLVIDHAVKSDLIISLSSPTGTTANVLINRGGSADDFNVLLNDQAATFVGAINHNVAATYPQFERRGSSNLATFNGEAANGIWTLSVCDNVMGNVGTFSRFQLDFLQRNSTTFSPPSDTAATGAIVNDYAAVTALSGTTLTVDSSAGFSAGDTGLLIQMKGATVKRGDNANHGDINAYGAAGRFEFVDIANVGSGTITLSSAPMTAFQTTGIVQLIRVASYNNKTLTGTTSALPWTGTKGGVVVIDDSGTLTLSGTIDVTGLGFQGGALVTQIPFDGCVSDQTNYTGPAANGSGNKGEGIVIDNSSHRARRGHNANGGGGGNVTDAGGGGGGNYGAGGLGGRELDLCDNNEHYGGLGGQALDYSTLNRVFMGGGGGSGSEVSQAATGGARGGGGIVIIRANQFVSSGGRIRANGLMANNDDVNGADGGGAAGSIAIAVNNGISGVPTIEAQGGNGGNEFNTEFAHGTGGGGGGGAIVLNGARCINVDWTAKKGLAGESMQGELFGDIYWGATDGEDGQCLENFTEVPELVVAFDYGDAPIDGTAPDGSSTNDYGEASHTFVTGFFLGASDPDIDIAHQHSTNADGDDNNGTDDEDGITIPVLTQNQTALITANVSGAGGYLQGWIDFNGDGDFLDAGEQIATNLQDNAALDTDTTVGSIAFNVAVPANAITTQTYARFRWSTVSGLDTTTLAKDGEVEDYSLTIIAVASVCNALTGDVNRGLNTSTQLRNADKLFIASSTETINQRKGHLKAFTVNQFGIPQTTAVWDFANKMNGSNRHNKLFSTHSNGNIVTLDSLDSSVFTHTGSPTAETIVRYTLDPSDEGGVYLHGRASGSYLGPISAGNAMAYISNDLNPLAYLNDGAYRSFSAIVRTRKERVLMTSDDGFLYAVKPNNGRLAWAWMPRSLVSTLHDPATLLSNQVMQGTIDVLDLKDSGGHYASYIVGSYRQGLGQYVLKLDSHTRSKSNLDSVIWESDERDTNNKAASSPHYGKRSYFSDHAGFVYAVYLITDTDNSTHLRLRSLTDTSVDYDIVLDYQATSAPYVMGAFLSGTTMIEKTLYLGDHQGNIYAAALLDSGSLISQSTLNAALKNPPVATMDNVASTSVQFIGSSKAYNGIYYLRAQSKDRLTVFKQQSGWKKAWTAYAGGAGTWDTNGNYTATTDIQALPTDALIENEARMVSNSLVLPISTPPTGNNCYRNAYYYFYDIEKGEFPTNRFFSANNTMMSGSQSLGKGIPQTLQFSDLPETNKMIGYGVSDQKDDGSVGVNVMLYMKDQFTTGLRSWRRLR